MAKNIRIKSAGLSGQSIWGSVLTELRDTSLAAVQETVAVNSVGTFYEYRERPVDFCKEVLGIKIVTPDQQELLNSIVTNEVTLCRSANGTGKTHIAASAAVWFYKTYSQLGGVEVYTTAIPEKNLKALLWKEIGKVVASNPGLFTRDDIKLASLLIQRSAEDKIEGVTIPQTGDAAAKEARFSGKHAPYMLFIVDEGDAIPPEVYKAIESCMSGGHCRLLILFNPRNQAGPLFQMERGNQANVIELSAFNHPNVLTGMDLIPGAVTREITGRRINDWSRPYIQGERIDKESFNVPEFMVGFVAHKKDKDRTPYAPIRSGLRKITSPEFSYMVLGRYSAQSENQLISRSDVERAQENWLNFRKTVGSIQHLKNPKLGVDVAEMGADFNVATPRYDFYVDEQEVWGGVDIKKTGEAVVALMKLLQAEGAYIDSNGLGAGVYPFVRDAGLVAHRIMVQESATIKAETDDQVIGEFERLRDQGWWTMREWLRTTPNAMLPPDDELSDQLLSASYTRNVKTGKIKICDNDAMKARLAGVSPDKASSLMMTFCPENDESGSSYLESHPY